MPKTESAPCCFCRAGVEYERLRRAKSGLIFATIGQKIAYYHGWRTHLGLDKDAPQARRVQGPEEGKIIAFPEVGGLHHRYERQAA